MPVVSITRAAPEATAAPGAAPPPVAAPAEPAAPAAPEARVTAGATAGSAASAATPQPPATPDAPTIQETFAVEESLVTSAMLPPSVAPVTLPAAASVLDAPPRAANQIDVAELYSRNWAFISRAQQEALSKHVVFAAGTGLASTIALLACRTGFRRFILADGDTVELSNLNRQAFVFAQIGRNKAEATAEALRGIRPDVDVETLPYFLDTRTYAEPLARADLVVNSMDYDNPALFQLSRAAKAAGKPMLIPLNLGWGGAVMAFTADSPALDTFLQIDTDGVYSGTDVVTRLVTRVFERAPSGVPPYLAELFAQFLSDYASWTHEPQLGVAAHVTAALVVRAAVALAAGDPIRCVPDLAYCDVRTILDPTAV